jgi:hypothetical protein
VPRRSACTSRPGGYKLVAQVKPETLYGVHQRSPPQTWLVRIGLLPPGTEGTSAAKRVGCFQPWSPVRRPLQRSRGAGGFRLTSSARAEVRGARCRSVGRRGRSNRIKSRVPAVLRSPYNKGLHLSRYAGRVPNRSACTSRPGGGMLVAQVKPETLGCSCQARMMQLT